MTGWSFSKSFRYAIDGIISFSVSPQAGYTYLGAIISLAGFAYAIYIIIKPSSMGGRTTAGFPTIVSLILILGGVNLLFLGLIGEYIGRILQGSQGQALYIIDDKEIKNHE